MEMDVPMLSQQAVIDFVRSNEHADEHQLVLKHRTIHGVSSAVVADQIRSRRKASDKLPTWYKTLGVIYPRPLNLEQSSSEATASYRTEIIREFIPGVFSGCDLTGGYGVDTFFLSKILGETTYVEPDRTLLEIARHNHQLLGVKNVDWVNIDAERFLQQRSGNFDLLYIDPSRREEGKKLYRLVDCEPNVIALQETWFNNAANVLIKASPLLDITQAIRELKRVSHVFVIAVNNEVKELLILCSAKAVEVTIHAINIRPPSQELVITARRPSRFDFRPEEERTASARYGELLQYVYEPDSAILKAGAFQLVAQRFDMLKLHKNSHLYSSAMYHKDFPGRVFEVIESVKPGKELQQKFPRGYANIIVRNHPLTVEEVKNKTGLQEGGDLYLLCTQSEKQKLTLIARRLA